MSQPGFHVARDAATVIQQWWLRPGEGLYWIRTGEHPVFEVPGRSGRGKVLKQAGWRSAGRRALAAAEGAAKVLDYLSTDPSTSDDPPGVRVFGTRIDCQAAVFAEAAQWESSWVLTDQRFALLRVTAPDAAPRVEAEVAAGQYGYHPRIKRRFVNYACVAFGDGSIVDFLIRPERR